MLKYKNNRKSKYKNTNIKIKLILTILLYYDTIYIVNIILLGNETAKQRIL